MDNRYHQHKSLFSPQRYGLSRKSLTIGAIFTLTLLTALFFDADALLEYFSVLGGSPGSALELGAIMTVASAAPLLAMGMSIADDEMKGRN